jgi:hypothetical protein
MHTYNWRQDKNKNNRKRDNVAVAFYEGMYCSTWRKKRPNPYPPGKRYDAWQRGRNVPRIMDKTQFLEALQG